MVGKNFSDNKLSKYLSENILLNNKKCLIKGVVQVRERLNGSGLDLKNAITGSLHQLKRLGELNDAL